MRYFKFIDYPWMYLSNYIRVFKPCIIQSLLIILVQPWKFLNEDKYLKLFMTQDAFNEILKLKEMDRGNLVRYYGVYNENLNFAYIVIRFTHLVYYFICYIFEEKVRLSRIYSIMGVNFKFMNMLKDLYRRFPVLGTSILMIISVYFYVQILMEYEIKINNISSIYESFFHVVVCMTTVGYGDKSALS